MVFAERLDGAMTLRRGFELVPEDRVLVAEDVVTTGGSQRDVLGLVEEAGARAVGVGAIVDRSAGVAFGVRFEALLRSEASRWSPDECPLCKRGEGLAAPGSRRARR
jgi:orotate phosphoribosyltransferase